MNRKLITLGTMLLVFASVAVAPVFAETTKDTARIEKLEERTRDLEARMAQMEASSHKQMGMMDKGMKMGMDNHPMGQMPQQVPQQNPGMGGAMPQGNAPQQQGGMPPGGMGDM